MYMGFQTSYPHYLLGFYCLSAHCSGSVLSRWQELFVSLPERSPQQSLPKVLKTQTQILDVCCCCSHIALTNRHKIATIIFLLKVAHLMITISDRFLAVVPSLADSSESVSGQRPNTSVEQG